MHDMQEKVILSAQVPTAQRDRLAHLAAVNERSLSGELRRALDTYLRLTEPAEDSSLGRRLPLPDRGGQGVSQPVPSTPAPSDGEAE